ncbi:RDD family protein [Vibrio aphrogenes]|uniref:RDD family protein n=1 Tax=Vibrio aphrogenes TaxID=1891186 RepID=UPI000B359FD4|nr:RDD family protein [Vibrio aphrogenes]
MKKFELRDTLVEYEYVGFWSRVGASIIDTILYSIVIGILALPTLDSYQQSFSTQTEHYSFSSYSTSWTGSMLSDTWWSYIPLLIVTVLFWKFKGATPGKMLIKAQVVDAKTGQRLTTVQSVIRYLGYFLSTFLFMLGFLWVAFDGRKQGLHDKIAGTVVIRPKAGTFKPNL